MPIIDPFDTPVENTNQNIVDPFEGIVDPFDNESNFFTEHMDEVRRKRPKNNVVNSMADLTRFFGNIFASGLNAIGTGVGEGLAGGSVLEGATKGATKQDFLGLGLGMETSAGQWVEEKLGDLFETVHEFGGEQAPKLLSTEIGRSILMGTPFTAPLVALYENVSDETKTKMEGLLSAGGASGPDIAAMLFGGRAAKNRVAKNAERRKGMSDEEIAASIREETPPEAPAPREEFSQTPDLFPETQETPFGTQTGRAPEGWAIDENGIPVNRERTGELQTTEQQPLMDEFLRQQEANELGGATSLGDKEPPRPQGIPPEAPDWTTTGRELEPPRGDNSIDFERVSPEEIPRTRQDELVFDDAIEKGKTPKQKPAEEIIDPFDMESVPTQLPIPGSTQRPAISRLGGVGKKQGGAVDFSIVADLFPAFKKSVTKTPWYHGTSSGKDIVNFRNSPRGIWLANDAEKAGVYAVSNDSQTTRRIPGTWDMEEVNSTPKMHQVYVNVQNPHVLTQAEAMQLWEAPNSKAQHSVEKAIMQRAKANGYDAVQYGEGILAVADSKQIVSAVSPEGIPKGMANRVTGIPENQNTRTSLGTSGFGRKQGGWVGDRMVGKKPESLSDLAKNVSKEDWVQEFGRRFPELRDSAERAYERTRNQPANRVGVSQNSLVHAVDKGLGIISTRIKNISPALMHRSREFERLNLKNTTDSIRKSGDFLIEYEALPKATREEISRAILNNDAAKLESLFKKHGGELAERWKQVREVLDDLGQQLLETGRLEGLRKDYFPRIVKDVRGLMEALGKEGETELSRMLAKAQTPIDESLIINKYLRGRYNKGNKPGFAKERQFDAVPKELEKFYATPTEALHAYIRSAVQDIETARFFGKSAIKDADTGRINLPKSIGEVVLEEHRKGKLSLDEMRDLQDMLESRFLNGNAASHWFLQDAKNFANIGLLGDLVSAGTQLADPLLSLYYNGIGPTILAWADQLTPGRKAKLSMKDFGLYNHVSEEFINQRTTARLVNDSFKLSGFTAIDVFGKDTILNAALNKAFRDVKTEKGLKNFRDKWEPLFGEEFPELVKDLQRGEITDRVNAMAFSRLSDVQPTTKLELPQKYLDMPNGRIIYMLKSFMLKQMDVVRNEAYNEFKKGNHLNAVSNLAKFSVVLGLSGATTDYIKDWLMGRDVDPELSDVPLNIFQTFGMSKYVADHVKQGNISKAVASVAMPPFKIVDDIAQGVVNEYKYRTSDDPFKEPPDRKYIQQFPIIGRMLYNHGFGGAERHNTKKENEKNKELLKELGL